MNNNREIQRTDKLGLTKVIDRFGTEQLLQHLNGNWDILDQLIDSITRNNVSVDKLPYFNIEDFKTSSNTYTDALKLAISNANSVPFYSSVLIPRSKTKYIFDNSTPIVLKDNLYLNIDYGAEIQFTGTANSLFTNDPTKSSLFLRIFGGGRIIANSKKLFDFYYSRTQPYGFSVVIEGVKLKGADTTRTGTGLNVGYTDFFHAYDLKFEDLDKAIVITSNDEIRGNTQIVLDTIYMKNVGTGVEASRLDKATFANVDIAQCGTGFLMHSSNMSVSFERCHVEYYDSYAFRFDGASNQDITFNNCTCFLPKDTAVAGFHSRQIEWADKGQNYFTFNQCNFVRADQVTRPVEVTSQPGYVPYVGFYCPSPFEWRGSEFDYPGYNKVSNDYPVGGAKIYPVLAQEISENLLPVANFNDSSLFTGYNAGDTLTIAQNSAYYNGVKLTWTPTAGGNVLRVKTKTPLRVGWHTLVLRASQINNNNLSVLVSRSNFTTVFNHNIAELSADYREGIKPRRTGLKTQTLTIPFYVDTAGDHYIAFLSASNVQYEVVMGGIQLFSGFVTEYKPIPRVWEKATVPTTGYWYKRDRIINPNAAVAGDKIGWDCVASGSPGTMLSIGTYGAP